MKIKILKDLNIKVHRLQRDEVVDVVSTLRNTSGTVEYAIADKTDRTFIFVEVKDCEVMGDEL